MAFENDKPTITGPPLSAAERREWTLFNKVAEGMYKRLTTYYGRRGIDYDEAQDLVSVAMRRAQKRLAKSQGELTEEFIVKVILSKANNALRHRVDGMKRREATGTVMIELDAQNTELVARDDPHALAEASETNAAVEDGMRNLAGQQEQVIRLVEQGYAVKEIAERIGSSANSAKTQVKRGRKKLKKLLKAFGIDI